MSRKKLTRHHLPVSKGFSPILLAFVFAIIYIGGSFLVASTTYAAGVPGGNIANPVVRAVDIAKPSVVRILTTLGGRLTVHFTSTISATFPQGGGSYKLQYLGSGAFISAHGDILTADHVIRPPHDASVDQDLYQMAAQDVADYINNNLNPTVQWTSNDAFSALSYGQLLSRSQYATPTSRVYLGTDFTGPSDVTTIENLPQNTYADVDQILKESSFQSMDTAIIHINKDNTPSIKLGDSSNVEQQDELTIIGYPGNGDVSDKGDPSTGFLTASVNRVYVSALKPNAGGGPLIQVGGNVEHGDSGGPALDSNGNIVGVVSFGGTNMPDGTSFLQASSSAQQMIDELKLDTRPGALQTTWNQAMAQYSSTQPGHWHLAQQQMQKLQNNYPDFHAIQPYLNYANTQASKEATTNNNTTSVSNSLLLIVIALIALIVIFLLVLFLFMRRKRPQAAIATQSSFYQPAYNGNGVPSDIQQTFNSGSMTPLEPKDTEDSNARTTPDVSPVQPRTMEPASPVSQTPTPVASSSFAQSGPMPAVPNRPPMNPWPQGVGYGSAPTYGQPGQPVPYGQQAPRPVQAPANTAYPAQPPYAPYPPQQQYAPNMPYPQAPATPWPPVSGNTPPPRPPTPYAPQNPGQQGVPIQRGQQPPAAPYGQSPQGYGAMPNPAQPRPAQPVQSAQQSSASIPRQQQQASAPLNLDEPTVRARPKDTTPSGEIAHSAEDKKNTPPSIPVPPKGQADTATVLSELNAPKQFGMHDETEEEH